MRWKTIRSAASVCSTARGNVLFAINYDSLLSADLFIALLEHMIHNRIPAYHNPAMTRPSV